MAAFVIGCSKSPSQPASTSSTTLWDLGVVSLADGTPRYLTIGTDKSCILTGPASSNGMIVMVLQETNADKIVRADNPIMLRVRSGHQVTVKFKLGDMGIRFTPEVNAK